MVKRLFLYFMLITVLNANFDANCVSCHKSQKVDLQQTFMSALLVYGGKKSFKTALFYYCKNPASMTSVMDEWYLKEHKTPKPISLDDITLKKMLDIYWKSYKVTNKLK